jgi:stearoyl-CoA desaturase (delta-9 desaturase)
VKQGFFWWEIDVTYYVLVVLSWFGLVWDLHKPPPHVVNANRVGSAVPKAPLLEVALSPAVVETPAE